MSLIPSSGETSAFANTKIDWKETPECHVFKADLPGVNKEQVKVEVVEGRVLQISGEKKKEKEEKNDKWHSIERSHGKFFRRFLLPENAKVEELKASMHNGVLTITVPKVEERRRSRRKWTTGYSPSHFPKWKKIAPSEGDDSSGEQESNN